MPEECFKELKPEVNNKKTRNEAATEVKHTLGYFIKCETFSSFRRLEGVTTYIMRAEKMFNSKRASQSSSALHPPPKELADAECRYM